MAIYITGDTHGAHEIGFHSVDGYMSRLNTEAFPEQKEMTKDDMVIICGDFGGVWKTDRRTTKEPASEKSDLDWLEGRPFTTLFVPGNHENYDRLTGCKNEKLLESWFYSKMPETEKEKLREGYPRKEWHGGYVRELRPSVLMLERGYVFDLNGFSCFAFGGAASHDISDGILDPSDSKTESEFEKTYQSMFGKSFRVRGVSWWDQEMPTEEEMETGRENILRHMRTHGKIDVVVTHDAPASDKIYLGYDGTDKLNRYLESLRDIMAYKAWFYGHLHENRKIMDKHYLIYEQIVRIY